MNAMNLHDLSEYYANSESRLIIDIKKKECLITPLMIAFDLLFADFVTLLY